MKKAGKNITKARQAVEARPYQLKDAVPLLQKVKFAKFDETVEITMRLGVDPKHADQMVRGTVVLPHGLGKSKRVLVIASGEKVKEAEQAGADYVGGEEMVEKINKENWTDFDALIATPDVMKSVGRLGKVLGPKGLMPNPKTGTVTFDVARAVQEVKAGKVEFRTDKTALVHVPVGKISFPPEKLVENASTLITSVIKATLIATPDVMKSVGRLGKVLGPKGLMPNPKTGTVTFDIARAVQEVKAGKVEFRTDKTALVHVAVGKISFPPEKLVENASTLITSVIKAKPSVAKGKYVKGCYLSSSMGPGISIDTTAIETAAKA